MATIREFKINDIKHPVGNIRREADTLKNHLIAVFDDENLAGTIITANVLDTELEGVVTLVQDYTADEEGTLTKGFSIIKDGQLFKVSISRTGGAFGDPLIEKLSTKSIAHTTWQELKTWRDGGLLTPGQQYRITDYVATTVQENTQSAGHQFDIIVTADSEDKLNENARACLHEGDAYFANSKLEAWQAWYCLDNDTSRFAWADTVNGKGVIYRMIDEFENDVPYDFKNIQFKRYRIISCEKVPNLIGQFGITGINDYVVDNDESYFMYTFNMLDLYDNYNYDVSVFQDKYISDEGYYRKTQNNIIRHCGKSVYDEALERNKYLQHILNNVVFTTDTTLTYILEDGSYGEFYAYNSNTFGIDCSSNTFGNHCHSNVFGNNCYSNTFGHGCSSNTFGNYCQLNTFGGYCQYNSFGHSCHSNTFRGYCRGNAIGTGCYSNTFGNYSIHNTFGNYSIHNTFGDNFYYNTFGDNCSFNKITGGSVQYINVDSGIQGVSNLNQLELYDSAIVGKAYQISFKRSPNGRYLMLWATDTGTMTGKYKATNAAPTWTAL